MLDAHDLLDGCVLAVDLVPELVELAGDVLGHLALVASFLGLLRVEVLEPGSASGPVDLLT